MVTELPPALVPEPKQQDVMALIQHRAKTGEFVMLPHAVQRRVERNVTIADIAYVLGSGRSEPERDEYRFDFRSWNYAVRGRSVDGHELRIAVAFDSGQMLVVTVIRLAPGRS